MLQSTKPETSDRSCLAEERENSGKLAGTLSEDKSAPHNKTMTRSACDEIACNICDESESCQTPLIFFCGPY